MKNKKGFTLIELLAVIIILAIIALIATPIIMNVIEKVKEGSTERSVSNYIDAVEVVVFRQKMNNNNVLEGLYNIDEDGNLCKEGIDCTTNQIKLIKVEMNGKKPIGGLVAIQNGKVVNEYKDTEDNVLGKTVILLDNKMISYKEDGNVNASACVAMVGNGTEFGNEIQCGTEGFYVLKNDGNEIQMLAKNNLNVGTGKNPNLTEGIQGKSGVIYGIPFADSNYWSDSDFTGTNTFVYNSNSNLYKHVENYRSYLKKLGVDVVDAKPASIEQIEATGCVRWKSSTTCPAEWLYKPSFWLGNYSSKTSDAIWRMHPANFSTEKYTSSAFGVRPVITIPSDAI